MWGACLVGVFVFGLAYVCGHPDGGHRPGRTAAQSAVPPSLRRLRGWGGGTRTGESVRELSDWNRVTTSPRGRKSGGGDPSCASCVTTVWPLRLGSVFGRILVRDPVHDAGSEGDAIDGLGKTPIIDQVGKPCLTQTARQCVVEILD